MPIKTNVRIVAATNKDLRVLIQQGFPRGSVLPAQRGSLAPAPPLRERVEDIPDLVRHFFVIVEKERLARKQLDVEAMDRLGATAGRATSAG